MQPARVNYTMLCGAEEACPAHNRKGGGSKPPKANRIQLTEHAQALAQLVERSNVEVKQTSNSRWFDSGKPDITTFYNFST